MVRDPLADNQVDDADLICAVSIARRVCGPQAAANLVRDFAGTRIAIPRRMRPDHPISRSIGHAEALALAAECGGTTSYIPMSVTGRANRRRALVHLLIGDDKTVPEIARATGHSERVIWRDISILRRRGIQVPRTRISKKEKLK
jgi:hypothetical protein